MISEKERMKRKRGREREGGRKEGTEREREREREAGRRIAGWKKREKEKVLFHKSPNFMVQRTNNTLD